MPRKPDPLKNVRARRRRFGPAAVEVACPDCGLPVVAANSHNLNVAMGAHRSMKHGFKSTSHRRHYGFEPIDRTTLNWRFQRYSENRNVNTSELIVLLRDCLAEKVRKERAMVNGR